MFQEIWGVRYENNQDKKFLFSFDLLTEERYDAWAGLILTLNDSYTLGDKDNALTMWLMANTSISYYFEIHDPHFHITTYISLAIPKAYFRLGLGEHFIGEDQEIVSFSKFHFQACKPQR